MGWIRRAPSGRWEARYRDAAGKEHSTTFQFKDAARSFLATIGPDGRDAPARSSRETFESYWLRWLSNAESSGRPSTRTLVSYRELWRLYVGPHLGAEAIGSITRGDVVDMVEVIAGKSAWRAQDALKLTRMLLNRAMDDDVVTRNVAARVKVPAPKAARIRILEPDELVRVTASLPDRYRAFVLVGAFCSLRWSELVALKADDIDLERQRIRIDEKLVESSDGAFMWGPPKTAGSLRSVDFPPLVLGPLRDHLEAFPPTGEGLVFYSEARTPIRRRSFRRVWERACAGAGVDAVRAGWLRHSGASLAYQATHDLKAVASRLGHTSTRMVDSVYVKLYADRDREVASAIEELFASSAAARLRRVGGAEASEPTES